VLQSIAELLLLRFKFAGNFFVLLYLHASTTQRVDRASLGRLHQPRTRIIRDTFLGPQFEGSDESVLSELLRNRSDEPRGFDLPHGLDCLVDITHACLATVLPRSNPQAAS
jgi:hypothetical protein